MPLEHSLLTAVEELGVGQKLARCQLQACWPELVGSTLAINCSPQKIQGQILWIRVRAPIFAQEIMLRQDSILTAILRRFPRIRLQQLRTQVGVVIPVISEEPIPVVHDLRDIVLPRSLEYRLELLASEIEDADLREAFLRALRQKERRDIWLRSQGALPCQVCGALQEYRRCTACLQELARDQRRKLFQLLGRQPWIAYSEAQLYLKTLRANEFRIARQQLLSLYLLNYYRERDLLVAGQPLPASLRNQMLQICMLTVQTPWDLLQDRHVRYALGKTWGSAYLEDKAPPPFDQSRFKKGDVQARAQVQVGTDD